MVLNWLDLDFGNYVYTFFYYGNSFKTPYNNYSVNKSQSDICPRPPSPPPPHCYQRAASRGCRSASPSSPSDWLPSQTPSLEVEEVENVEEEMEKVEEIEEIDKIEEVEAIF